MMFRIFFFFPCLVCFVYDSFRSRATEDNYAKWGSYLNESLRVYGYVTENIDFEAMETSDRVALVNALGDLIRDREEYSRYRDEV